MPNISTCSPYRSGIISAPVILRRADRSTEIAFVISGDGIYAQMTVDQRGRMWPNG